MQAQVFPVAERYRMCAVHLCTHLLRCEVSDMPVMAPMGTSFPYILLTTWKAL